MSPHDARGMWKASFITTNVIISHSSSSIMHSYNGIVLVLFIIGRSFQKSSSKKVASLVSVIAYSAKNTIFFSQIGSNEGIVYKTFYNFSTLVWTMIFHLTVILVTPRHTYLVCLGFLGKMRRCPWHKTVRQTFAKPSDHGVWGNETFTGAHPYRKSLVFILPIALSHWTNHLVVIMSGKFALSTLIDNDIFSTREP